MTGTPAAAGPARAELTPGTTVNGTPAAARASASSPPRPNTKGSPPFSRTTLAVLAAELDEERVDGLLRVGEPGPLADVDQLGRGVGQRSGQLGEPVVDDDVRAGEQPGRPHREQLGVTGTGPDEVDGHRLGSRR